MQDLFVQGGTDMENKQEVQAVLDAINNVILGKQEQVQEVFIALLAGGHILLEDIPGVGKTTLAIAFSKVLNLDFARVQFTPDVLPSDLSGFSIYHKEEEKFVFSEGPVFSNLLLADEINRTSPKTQSALLEVMEEKKVTVDGVTRAVREPFHVIATENPYGAAGTQPLPEAQLDRFMISLSIGYPDFESELALMKDDQGISRNEELKPCMTKETFVNLQKAVHNIYMDDKVYNYALQLIRATREHAFLVQGASPRASLYLVRLAKAMAMLMGRDYVLPGDVAVQFPYVISHRMVLRDSAIMKGIKKQDVIQDILKRTKQPSIGVKRR